MVRGEGRFEGIVAVEPGFGGVDRDTALDQRAHHRLDGGVFTFSKILDALDAGQLVLHRARDIGWLKVDRDDRLFALGSEGEFL
ncbi:MAG: hypothetical protein HOB97_01690, partial [Verrucomicrobia bacterium]|nr:hypothetical protein [Verrucomicrobiota bacterium]